MPDLVALAVPAGPHFYDAVARIWSQDDAVLPIDLAWPAARVQQVLATMKPVAVVDQGGRTSLHKAAAKAGWTRGGRRAGHGNERDDGNAERRGADP